MSYTIDKLSAIKVRSVDLARHVRRWRLALAAGVSPVVQSSSIGNAAINPYNHRMNCGDYTYIWQAPDWPNWRYDLAALVSPLAQVSQRQGLLLGRLADIRMACAPRLVLPR